MANKWTQSDIDDYEAHIIKQEEDYMENYESKGLHDQARKHWLERKNQILQNKKDELSGRMPQFKDDPEGGLINLWADDGEKGLFEMAADDKTVTDIPGFYEMSSDHQQFLKGNDEEGIVKWKELYSQKYHELLQGGSPHDEALSEAQKSFPVPASPLWDREHSPDFQIKPKSY